MAWERFWNGGFLLGMRFIACMVLLSGRASFVLGEEGVRGVKAENWVQWRGPTADGIASPTANPPLQWDSKTNIAWVADLPGQGTSTPIIWDDQVFVLSAEKTSRKSLTPVENDERAKTVPDEFFHRFLVTSIDRVTGKMRWQKLATEQVPHEGRHMTNTYAAGSPTPVTLFRSNNVFPVRASMQLRTSVLPAVKNNRLRLMIGEGTYGVP